MENKINNYDTKLEELLDCPFCGSRPTAYLIGNEHSTRRVIVIHCKECNVERRTGAIKFDTSWLEETAIKSWNNRVAEQSIRADERGKVFTKDERSILLGLVTGSDLNWREDYCRLQEKLLKLEKLSELGVGEK